MRLRVLAEVSGARRHVGSIETLPGYGERFTYSDEWRALPGVKPLSLSLPISERPYPAPEMRPYFEGLLPEEDARRSVAANLGVSPNAYLKLLRALGDECIGAVMIADEEAESAPPAEYRPLVFSELEAIVSKGYVGTSTVLVGSRLSIAGAQAKIGLYRRPGGDGTWYVPHGTAPATHVIKPAGARFEAIVANECLCLAAARKCGLSVPSARALETKHAAIVVERYDRAFFGDESTAGGLPMPFRLHQEDLCQALGILSEDKYGDRAMHSVREIGRLIREWSADPIGDLTALWDVIAFNYFIGNCDDHIKNLSLVRDRDWSSIRLAPFYDLVSTTVYPELTRRMGLSIGSARNIDDVIRADFAQLAEDLGVSEKMMLPRLDTMREALESCVSAAAIELAEGGCAGVEDMRDRILADAERRIVRMGE